MRILQTFLATLFCIVMLVLVTTTARADQENRECVIVLHGLGRTEASMGKIEKTLANNGYLVWNEAYPSREAEIEILAANHLPPGIRQCEEWNAGTIHFVTHSMGGILVRYYFQNNDVREARRVVMLAPPNRGSEITDRYRDEGWYQYVTGPAGQQLGTEENSVPNSLTVIPLEVGIIAGSNSSDPWFSTLFNGDNDGKVSVASTRLTEMTAFLVVESGHTFIMNNEQVKEQILYFLRNGEFNEARNY